MASVTEAFAALEARITAWAEQANDIRSMIVVGSRARTDTPADEWSDLDLLLFTTDPARYVASADWLDALGRTWATFTERTVTGDFERRVLFEGGLDVDFVPVPLAMVEQAQQSPLLSDIVRRGVRVLVDKDGLLAAALADLPSDDGQSVAAVEPPSAEHFHNVVNDFWFHTVWTAKKLRRGERWMAHSCLNGYLRYQCLQPVIEWHAKAAHGWDYDTWHGGRFFDQWADPRAVDGLRGVFSHYDDEDIRAALLASMDLFRWLAVETAARLGYSYPHDGDAAISAFVRNLLVDDLLAWS